MSYTTTDFEESLKQTGRPTRVQAAQANPWPVVRSVDEAMREVAR